MKQPFVMMLLCLFSIIIFCQTSEVKFSVSSQNGIPVPSLDRGKFLIFAVGQLVGAETFHLRADQTGESSDEFDVGGEADRFSTLLVLDAQTMRAKHFTIAHESGGKFQLDVNGANVKVTGSKQASVQTDPDAVILENNVWYHYYFLLRRYDRQRGGAQQFKAFVPAIMQTIPVSVEYKEEVALTHPASARLSRFEVITAEALKIEVLTDSSGKLVYTGIPSQHVEVVREEYRDSLAQLRVAVTAKPLSSADKPDYTALPGASFTAEEITIKVNSYALAGTLLLPKKCGGPCPAVVMITGSGQENRDEVLPIAGLEKYRPFRQIAEELARHRIAVLRVDDRGAGSSTGAETLTNATTSDFANDTRAQVAYLRTRREIDSSRIALVGHSEGGTIAPMLAVTDSDLAAIVLLAGSGKKGSEISLYQAQQALESRPQMSKDEKEQALAEQRQMIKAVQEGGDLSKYPAEARLPWVKEFFTYDPIQTIRQVRQPLLILQGALDRQITADNAELLAQAARAAGNQDVTLHVFPQLNHLFLPARIGSLSEYSSLQTSIPNEVLTTISDWLQHRLQVVR